MRDSVHLDLRFLTWLIAGICALSAESL